MSEEPSLPPLPTVIWNELPPTIANGARKRLRQVLPNTGTTTLGLYNSSDPAVFSSDDDPGLDNYVSGRRKRKYVGSWYQQFPTSSDSTMSEPQQQVLPRPRQGLRRQLDSGVFLGDNGTTDDENTIQPIEIPILPIRTPQDLSPEEMAEEKVRTCLEHGHESIDFWCLNLGDISNEMLKPLSYLSYIPQVARDVAFEQRDPRLKMYLVRNGLRRLPGSLFDLGFLTVLSLRDNDLTELPASISKLSNLLELNVSLNKLRTLPSQFLDLIGPTGRLKKLSLFPNAFVQPERGAGVKPTARDLDLANSTFIFIGNGNMPWFLTRYLGQTPQQFSTSKGFITSKFHLSVDATWLPVEYTRKDFETNNDDMALGKGGMWEEKQSRVPSLVEMALRCCHNTSKPENLVQFIPDELQHLRELVLQTGQQKHYGGLLCSTCRKSMVMPAIQWVEWRDFRSAIRVPPVGDVGLDESLLRTRLMTLSKAPDETAVPFIYRACSRQCGPVGRKFYLGWSRDLEQSEFGWHEMNLQD